MSASGAVLPYTIVCSHHVMLMWGSWVQDEENLQRAHNEVPTDDELNIRLARSPTELTTFRAMDAEMDAASQPMGKSKVDLT